MESPPSAKKLSCRPTRLTWRTRAKIVLDKLLELVGRRLVRRVQFLREPMGQVLSLQLAGWPLGYRLDDHHAGGHLEVREMLEREVTHVGFGQRLAVPRHHRGGDAFPQRGMGHAKRRRLLHVRVAQQHLVDLARRDLFAPAVDDLLETARQHQVALVVEPPLVARSTPAVRERAALAAGLFS